MTLESRVKNFMASMERRFPDDDPGDLSIEWQDDFSLVTATQAGFVGIGQTADDALDSLISQRL